MKPLNIAATSIAIVVLLVGLFFAIPMYFRYQAVQNADNEIIINERKMHQTQQLVQVETQKAQIRVEEAKGIAEAQHLINATLTDQYLQHEAIDAQLKMAGSPAHTQIYIPVGQNGIPIVHTTQDVTSNNNAK